MPRRTCTSVLVMSVLAVAPLAAQHGVTPARDLEQLAWLAGCWRLEARDRVMDEQWMAPRAGLMMGMNRTVQDGRVREFERLSMRAVDGRIEYVAEPSGQREAVFTLTLAGDSVWAFTNEAHDFPQRIVYQRTGPDSLVAQIAGETDGRHRSVDFPMRRVPCDRSDP